MSSTSDEGLALAHLSEVQGQPGTHPEQLEPVNRLEHLEHLQLDQLTRDIAAARARGLSVFQIRKRLRDGLPLDAPAGTWSEHKRAAAIPASAKSVTVRGQFFKGYQSACHQFGLPPKRVRRVSVQRGLALGEAIEWCLQEKAQAGASLDLSARVP